MIRPQVPLRQPCYDFSFLQTDRLAELRPLREQRRSEQLASPSKSVGATGGVYKRQGRSRRALVTDAY